MLEEIFRETSLSRNFALAASSCQMARQAIRKEDGALRAAVVRFMEGRKLKPTPWAEKAGVPESTFRSFLSGKARAPRHDTLEKLARAADATLAELVGERLTLPRGLKDALPIKSLEVKASAGGGFQLIEEPEGPPFYFRKDWIESLLERRPGRLRVHWFEGLSMIPTINDGDVGLIHLDYGGNEPGIYTLWDGSGLVAKRLESLPGNRSRVRVISDNPQYPPYEIAADEAFVVGRVIWRGGLLL